MAKILAYDDEARQKLASGVTKLARAVRCTLGPRGRNAVIDKGWGSPTVTKDGVTVAEEIELTDPYENMGAQLVKEAASKTSDAAGDGTTTATVLAEAIYKEGLKALAAGADPMALKRGIDKAVAAVVEHVKAQSQEGFGQEGDHRGRRRSPPTTTLDRREAGRRLRESRHRRRHHRRGGQGLRDDRRRRRGHAVRPRLPEPALRHRPGADGSRPGRRLRADLRGEDQLADQADPASGEDGQGQQAALDHRRGHRGRGAGDPGRQQAAGHSQGRGRQGPGLRRPPQGHAGRHRRADRRQGDLQGPGHRPGEHPARRPRPCQEGHDRQREHHDRRGCRHARGDQGAGRHDPPRDRATPTASTTARSSRNGSPSWPAASPRSTSAPPPRPR